MKIDFRALLVILLLLTGQLNAQSAISEKDVASIDEAVELQMEQQNVVGAAIGVIRDGKVVYTNGYGWADREDEIPVTTESMFRWASVSKPVTAIAAMQLVDQRRLDLYKDVRDYVPDFPDKEMKITTRDLMCHQSGIVHYVNGPVIRTKRDYDIDNPYQDVLLALDTFKESPLVNDPGAKVSYSTHAYILLSAVVQKAGDAPFYDQVKQRICEPLGLETLQPDYQWIEIDNRVTGYRRIGPKIVRSSNTDVSWKLGGGGFISDIDDMAGLAAGLVNGKLLSEEAYDTMWTVQETRDGKATNFGLGFSVREVNGTLQVSHNGSQEKTRTRMVIYPERKFGVVFMTNTEFADPGRFTTAVTNALTK